MKMHSIYSFPFLFLSLSLCFLSLLASLEVQKRSGGGGCWITLEVEATVSQTPDISSVNLQVVT